MEWVVTLHSYWRWVVLLVAIGAIALSLMSAFGSRPWDSLSSRLSLIFTIVMDVQFLIGVIVWVTKSAWSGDAVIGWLHPLAMLGAVALAHVGRARADRATNDVEQGKQASIFFVASLVVVLVAIPFASWPV